MKLRRAQPGPATVASWTSGRRCPSCAVENLPDAQRCRFCGAWLFDMATCGLCSQVISTRIDHCVYCGAALAACNLRPYTLPARKRSAWGQHPNLLLTASVVLSVLLSLLILIGAGALTPEPLAGDNPVTATAGVVFAAIVLALGILSLIWVFSGRDTARDLTDLYPDDARGVNQALDTIDKSMVGGGS